MTLTTAPRLLAQHRAQRAFALDVTGLAIAPPDLPLSDRYPVLPLKPEQRHILVNILLSSGTKPSDHVWLQVGAWGIEVAEDILEALDGKVASLHVQVIDTDFQNWLFAQCSDDQITAFGAAMAAKLAPVTRRFSILPMTEEETRYASAPDKAKLYQAQLADLRAKSMRGEIHSTLTLLPTPKTAHVDFIPFEDYVNLFIDMCDQPWDAISAAHLHLIAQLNKAETIRFTNDDGTDVRMALTDTDGTPFTFCNSLTKRNVPGSEVFSAPRRDSVNGVVVAKGQFLAEHKGVGGLIRDLTMHFENGRIVDFSAVEGAEHFQAYLDRDPNNRFTGELGIGTNPYLKRHVCNTLLVEKIGGSFHLALGDAYTMTDYLGTPVYVNNGNKTESSDHWDITTMLFGKGGKMILDGRTIMEDGVFIDPALDVLNRGWAALPDDQIPQRWRGRKTAFI